MLGEMCCEDCGMPLTQKAEEQLPFPWLVCAVSLLTAQLQAFFPPLALSSDC